MAKAANSKLPIEEDSRTAFAQEQLRRALVLHREGKLVPARELYEAVLRSHPDQYDATRLLGVIAYQQQEYQRAVDLYQKAIDVNPGNPLVYLDLGNVLKRLGHSESAMKNYDRAIALRRDYHEAYTNRGNTLVELQQLEAAVASYDRAIAIKPDFAQAHYGRGRALREMGKLEDAVAGYERAIALKPDYPEAYYDRGNALRDMGRFETALASYDRAIAAKPDYAEAHNNRGNALLALGQPDAALAAYERAIVCQPNNAQAHNNRGKLLQELGQQDAALACYERSLELDPQLVEACNNRGNLLVQLGRHEEAIACYDHAIAIDPDHAELRWNKALLLLLLGDFRNGWPLYEWRWKNGEFASRRRSFAQPPWRGNEPIRGKTILLHNEQGLGDLIQFCRYAKPVSALGARVVLEVPRQLMGLLQGLDGISGLVERGTPLPPFDCHCSLLSLPFAFRTALDTVPVERAYLRSDAAKREAWGRTLGPASRKRIGLVWSGNPGHKNDRNRSVPLDLLVAYLPDGYEYVCLQRDLRDQDRDALQRDGRIRFFGDDISDFDDTAALCDLMDLVISVDTSVAHLAGALGRRTWVLLPVNPDWRWMLYRTDSPWYPTARLLRQHEIGDWTGVLRDLSLELNALLLEEAWP